MPVSIDRLPLFVKAGSIIPTSEAVEYSAAQADKPITLYVYPGADASFSLYQDSGDGYNFEQGDYTLTKYEWDDKKQRMKQKAVKKSKKYNREIKVNIIN